MMLTLPETNSKNIWKMVVGKLYFPFGKLLFSVANSLLVLGNVAAMHASPQENLLPKPLKNDKDGFHWWNEGFWHFDIENSQEFHPPWN